MQPVSISSSYTILIVGQMVSGTGSWSRLRVTIFYGCVMLSQLIPSLEQFPPNCTAIPAQDGWGGGPGEEVSSGGRIVMGEESAEGHFSWYCCQKKCSLNHSPVACPAKSCGSSQCQGHNPAFQPSVLGCHLFSSQCVWQLFGTVVRHGVVGAERGSAWCWMAETPNWGQTAEKKVLVRTWSPVLWGWNRAFLQGKALNCACFSVFAGLGIMF